MVSIFHLYFRCEFQKYSLVNLKLQQNICRSICHALSPILMFYKKLGGLLQRSSCRYRSWAACGLTCCEAIHESRKLLYCLQFSSLVSVSYQSQPNQLVRIMESRLLLMVSLSILLLAIVWEGHEVPPQRCHQMKSLKYWPRLTKTWNKRDSLGSMKRVFDRFNNVRVNGSAGDD